MWHDLPLWKEEQHGKTRIPFVFLTRIVLLGYPKPQVTLNKRVSNCSLANADKQINGSSSAGVQGTHVSVSA